MRPDLADSPAMDDKRKGDGVAQFTGTSPKTNGCNLRVTHVGIDMANQWVGQSKIV
jgi:hypothetical protein